jgi:tRNA(fMet)-specific endonuclease VapC
MKYLLDTNIVLLYQSGVQSVCEELKKLHILEKRSSAISIVTVGELEFIILQRNWGKQRLNKLEKVMRYLAQVPIAQEDLVKRYAEIDAFSQGKLKDRPLNNSARNMGKNDLWIAATASVTDATLVTTDNDFDHLDGEFVKLLKLPIA